MVSINIPTLLPDQVSHIERIRTWEEMSKMTQDPIIRLGQKKKFDPDFGPEHPENQEAARERGLTWDSEKDHYVDEDGFLRRDRYGQPL